MANDKDKFIDDDLLDGFDSVLTEEPPLSKLSGVDDEGEDNLDEETKPKKPVKKGSKLPLILGASLVVVVAFGALIIKMDMNKKAQQAMVNQPGAEQMLFGQQNDLPVQQQGSVSQEFVQETISQPAQTFIEPDAYQESWSQTEQTFTQSGSSEQQQWSQVQTQTEPVTQYVSASAAPALQTQQQPDVSTEVANLASQISALYALINDLTVKQSEIETKMSQINSMQKNAGANENDLVTRKQFLDSLRSVRAVQAQSEKTASAVKVIEEKLGLVDAPKAKTRSAKQEQTTTNSSSAISSEEKATVQTAQAANQVVVQESAKRQARELAWSSYIEDFGVATIEGTPDLIELRPGDIVVGRGMIEKITPFGCIEFTNKTRYAPTNGECK